MTLWNYYIRGTRDYLCKEFSKTDGKDLICINNKEWRLWDSKNKDWNLVDKNVVWNMFLKFCEKKELDNLLKGVKK